MTAELDDVRPRGDVPPAVCQSIRWHWCGSRRRYQRRAQALAAGPSPVYGCPFDRTGKRGHWHAGQPTPDDLVVIAAVARSPRPSGPLPDPRPGRHGLWVVTDGATGRILATCPPPPSTPLSPDAL